MFKKILLPLDGSQPAEITIPYGREIAGAFGAELVLYHVHGRDQAHQGHMHLMYLEKLAETVRRDIAETRGKESPRVTTMVEAGEPVENICKLVTKNRIDLIIMSSNGASVAKVGKSLGSVADRVCQTVPVPVMLLRPSGAKKKLKGEPLIKHIMITLDGSENSKLALPVGEALADKFKSKVTLFRMATMLRILNDAYAAGSLIHFEEYNRIEKTRVTAEMTALENDMKSKGFNVKKVVTSGYDAAYDIIELADRRSADLLVMASHGESGFKRWVYGSVAEKVLRHSEIPLLLVHARAR